MLQISCSGVIITTVSASDSDSLSELTSLVTSVALPMARPVIGSLPAAFAAVTSDDACGLVAEDGVAARPSLCD